MATIYKLKLNGKFSKRNFTLSGARALRKQYEAKGLEPKIIVWKERQTIVDTTSEYTGVINYYRNPTEKELKQMIAKESA